MPVNNETLNKTLYDTLRSRGYDPVSLDSKGDPTDDIESADVFRFTYKNEDGKPGQAWATIEGRYLVVYYDDDFTKSPEFENFTMFMKRWAQRRTLAFKMTNRDHLVGDMKKRTVMKKKEELSEGYYALGKKASYSDSVPQVKMIIQHTRQIEEGEQRFRNVAKIFVENQNGERFLVPTIRPGLARVYARHVAEGGTPYDEKGKHITTLIEEYSKMAGFVRATRGGQFNESALKLVNEGLMHYNNLRMTLQGMTGHRGYNKYFESYTPMLNEETDDDVSLNELFVEETLDPRIESVLPILKRLSKNITEMSEVKELEEWAQSITEVEDETTKTLAVPADEMLEDLDEGLGSKLLAGAALIATLWGINYKQAQEVYSNSPQLQKLEQLHTQAVEMGDKAKVKELEKRIGDHKTRLDLGYGEVMGKGGVPKEVNEAPGAETLAHNQKTVKGNLDAFDLDENDNGTPQSHQAKTTLKHLKKASYGDRADAANIEPGIKGFRDRIAMLQRAKDEGNLVDEDESLTSNSQEQGLAEDTDNPVAGAITRRILSQRLDLLKKYGPVAVTQAIDDVADFVGDVDEIGSSDVSGWIRQVEQSLGGVDEGVVGNMINKAKGMFNKPAAAPAAAPAKAAPVVPDAATKARIAAAPQGYDPNTGKPQVAAKAAPGAVAKGGTMDMTKKVVAPAAKPAAAPASGGAGKVQGIKSNVDVNKLQKFNGIVDVTPKIKPQIKDADGVTWTKTTAGWTDGKRSIDPKDSTYQSFDDAWRVANGAQPGNVGVAEDLDANQKRVGQLGPTEPVGKDEKNLRGKLVGANESVEFKEAQDDLDAILRIIRK